MEVPAKFKSALVGLRYWLLALIFMTTSTFLGACGGGDTTTTFTPTPTTTTTTLPTVANSLIIINTPTNVFANGVIDITAFATYNSVAVAGEIINSAITVNNSSSSLDLTSAVTGSNGQAFVTYTAGPISGVTDTITVTSTTEQTTHLITVTPLPGGSVVVTASSGTLVADAAAQTLIEALVKDTGDTIMAGADVEFTTTAGTMCDYPACGGFSTPLTAQTDSFGIARIFLQSSTNLETATVTGRTTNLLTDSTNVEFIAGPPGIITLQANPTNITADDGFSTSTVTAFVTDADYHIVADGVSVSFAVTGGAGTGSFSGTATGNTDGGLAFQDFTAGDTPGDIDITATAGSATSADGTTGDNIITLIAEAVGTVTTTLDSSLLVADGADFTAVNATVTNSNGDPINNGTPVTFKTIPTGGNAGDLGSVLAGTPVTPGVWTLVQNTIGGNATVLLQSSTVAGSYSVSATSGSKVGIAAVDFVAGLAAPNPQTTFTVSPVSIAANGTSTSTLTVFARDVSGNPVVDGTAVTFTAADPGAAITNITTTTGGIATATLTSSFTVDPAVLLSATVDGITETSTIAFFATADINPSSIDLTLSATTIPIESVGGSGAILITATVNDTTGLPLQVDCPDNIVFEIISGPLGVELDNTLTPVTKTTVDGVASVSLTAGTDPGTVRVEVRATRDSASCALLVTPVSVITTAITIASGEAALINLFPESKVIDIPATDITGQIFNAQVVDAVGNPVQTGTAIRFYLDENTAGTVCPWGETGRSIDDVDPSCYTDTVVINGVARTLLSYAPSSIWGSYDINAETESGAAPASYHGFYRAVEGVTITVSISPPTVPAGTIDITVFADYRDGSTLPDSNPLIGRTLTFTSDNPAVAYFTGAPEEADTNANGEATTSNLDTTGVCINTTIVPIRATEERYSGSANLTVTGNTPTSSFVTGGVNPDFTFASNSTTPTGIITDSDCVWDFGDGDSDITSCTVSHDYSHLGTGSYAFTASLTVTNSEGCTNISSQNVSVTVP